MAAAAKLLAIGSAPEMAAYVESKKWNVAEGGNTIVFREEKPKPSAKVGVSRCCLDSGIGPACFQRGGQTVQLEPGG